jgi:hypothetical protein
MSDQLHPERETGLAEDVESKPLQGELDSDGQAVIEPVDEEEDYR